MKYVMAAAVLALVACGGQKNRPPPNEPASVTTTTSAALTLENIPEAVPASETPAPIMAKTASDNDLGTKIRAHLERDQALRNVGWKRVSLEISDGHVTMRGYLPTIADSSEMERSVREVKGVKAVTNEIHENVEPEQQER